MLREKRGPPDTKGSMVNGLLSLLTNSALLGCANLHNGITGTHLVTPLLLDVIMKNEIFDKTFSSKVEFILNEVHIGFPVYSFKYELILCQDRVLSASRVLLMDFALVSVGNHQGAKEEH